MGGTEQAIYVALDIPTDMANMNCYDNRDGPNSQEWEAFELFMKTLDANYCIDLNRIYVTGYSTGGWLGNMWGCYFAGDGTGRKFAPSPFDAAAPGGRVRYPTNLSPSRAGISTGFMGRSGAPANSGR